MGREPSAVCADAVGAGGEFLRLGSPAGLLADLGQSFERFRNRVFTAAEVQFCETLGDKYPSYAGRFAAKEAFSKALGTGLRGAIGWTEIDVCDNERSRPTIRVTGRAEKILAGRKVHVSISHLPDYATAIVVIED